MTHLIITYRAAGFQNIDQDDANFIIKTYVDMFMASHAQPASTLAPYIAQLPSHDQVLSFASLLQTLSASQEEKVVLLDLASEFGMDRFAIALRTVELVLGESIPVPTSGEATSQEELKLIDCLGWLAVDEENYAFLALQGHRLARRFLSEFRSSVTSF